MKHFPRRPHRPRMPLPCINLEETKKNSAVCFQSGRSIKRNHIIAYALLSAGCLAAMLSGVLMRPLLVKKPLLGPLRQVGTTLQGKAAVDYLKEQGIYQQLRASIEATNYELTRAPQTGNSVTSTTKHSPEVYLASNPAQKLSAQFSAEEVRLESSQGEAKEAVLKLRGYGYGKNMLALSAGSTRVAGSRVEISRTVEEAPSSQVDRKEPTRASQGSVTEWYRNN